jgi:hypothetical protein
LPLLFSELISLRRATTLAALASRGPGRSDPQQIEQSLLAQPSAGLAAFEKLISADYTDMI